MGGTLGAFINDHWSVSGHADLAYRLHGPLAVRVGPSLAYAHPLGGRATLYPSFALLYEHASGDGPTTAQQLKRRDRLDQLTLELAPAVAIELAEHLSLLLGLRVQQSVINRVASRQTTATTDTLQRDSGPLTTTYGVTAGLLGWL